MSHRIQLSNGLVKTGPPYDSADSSQRRKHGRWSEECSHAVDGAAPAEDLPWALVQLGLHEGDVGVGVDGQVGGLGEAGAQQAVRVLVGRPLPW